jgi:hypothetical protein
MSWAAARPEPLSVAHHATIDALGRSRAMTTRRWAWLIGMTGADDETLLRWARSYARPPSIEAIGARLDPAAYVPERRALRLHVLGPSVTIRLKPEPVCVNPVFELDGAPRGGLTIRRDGRSLKEDSYAWDGHVLWLDATIRSPAEMTLSFGPAS